MRYEDFENSPAGALIPTLYNEKSFKPNALPPELDLSCLVVALSKAMAALGELKGACRRLANPYILIRPLQRSEALTSSAMEGTYTTDDELLLADAGIQTSPSDDTREVTNYIRALSTALREVENGPITNRLLRKAHHTLLWAVSRYRGLHKLPGEFKRDQNMIGGADLRSARFIPPPPKVAEDCMSDLEKFINREAEPAIPLIDIALAHYQFETIHPFADGNGRVGRMLISLMVVKNGLLDTPALYLSPVLETRKSEYIDLMYRVSSKGDWSAWLNFFFDVVTESCLETIATVDRLIELQDSYKKIAADGIKSANAASLIDILFGSPAITIKDVVRHLGITDPGARKLVARLVELDILTEYSSLYPKAYLAHGVISASKPRPLPQ